MFDSHARKETMVGEIREGVGCGIMCGLRSHFGNFGLSSEVSNQ